MSSETVTNELDHETLRTTYTRLSVLCDAAQTLLEMAECHEDRDPLDLDTEAALPASEWMNAMRSDLSKHNHKDLISDDKWRLRTLESLQNFDEGLKGGLRLPEPLEPTFRLILSDMQESFTHPLVSR